MSYYEDLTRIKVNDAIQAGLKAQHDQRNLADGSNAPSGLLRLNPLKWLALLAIIFRGGWQ